MKYPCLRETGQTLCLSDMGEDGYLRSFQIAGTALSAGDATNPGLDGRRRSPGPLCSAGKLSSGSNPQLFTRPQPLLHRAQGGPDTVNLTMIDGDNIMLPGTNPAATRLWAIQPLRRCSACRSTSLKPRKT